MRLCLKTSGHANTFNPAGLCNKVDALQKRIRKRGKRQVEEKSGSLCLQLFSSIVKREREREASETKEKSSKSPIFFFFSCRAEAGDDRLASVMYMYFTVYIHTIRNPIPLNWTGGILLQQASPPIGLFLVLIFLISFFFFAVNSFRLGWRET